MIKMICLQQYYRNAIFESNIAGIIQSLGHDPFRVHLYTEDQVNFHPRLNCTGC